MQPWCAEQLSKLIELWYQHHGSQLRAGENTFSRLKNLVAALGDPMADRFSVEDFAAYRTKRIEQGISLNNLNREHAYLRAVFNELATLGYWKKENPLAKLRQFKIPVVSQRLSEERELIWLETWV